jgi:hypothetical protein
MILVFAHVKFASENGPDAFGLGGIEEVNGPIDVAVVSHSDRLLAEGSDSIDELGDVAGAVKEGIFGVQMEMSELRHGDKSILVLFEIGGCEAE